MRGDKVLWSGSRVDNFIIVALLSWWCACVCRVRLLGHYYLDRAGSNYNDSVAVCPLHY